MKKIKMMGKKGEIPNIPSKMLKYVFTLVILLIGMGTFLWIASHETTASSTPRPEAEKAIAQYRLMNSPECFAFVDDETGVPDTGLFDLSKFSQKTIDECYIVKPQATGKECFKLTLYDFHLGEKRQIAQVQTANFPVCYANKKIRQEVYIARIYDKGTVKRGIIEVQSKKGA